MRAHSVLLDGIAAYESGDRTRARTLLARVIREDASCKEAWWWLSKCLDDPEQVRFCLERVLSLDPKDSAARAAHDPLNLLPRTEAPRASSGAGIPANETPAQLGLPRSGPLSAERATSPKSAPSPRHGPRRWGRFVAAFLAGLLIVAGPVLWAVLSGGFDGAMRRILGGSLPTSRQASPEEAVVALPAGWTATLTNTTRPPTTTPSPTPTLELSYDQRLILAEADIENARQLTGEEQYAEAVLAWDRVLERIPDCGEGHYYRAKVYLALFHNQRFAEEALANLMSALADIDRAIELGPVVTGDYYLQRANIFYNLATMAEYRVDYTALMQPALENLRVALALGVTGAADDLPFFLILAGSCREGILEARRLVEARGAGQPPSGTLNTALALGYLCEGQFALALRHIDVALTVHDTWVRRWQRAIILYQLGRTSEALAELNALIDEAPEYEGYRYFLRGLIHYENGDLEQAREDLRVGAGNTWSRGGLYAYVLGRIKIDEGNMDAGLELIRHAEASDLGFYGPMLERFRRELAELGGTPLEVTPALAIIATPIPTPLPTVTPRPLGRVAPTPEGLRTVDMTTGTGPIALPPNEGWVIRFQPARGLQYEAVERVSVHLLTQRRSAEPTLFVHPWVYEGGGWAQVESPQWGENDVRFPERYVTPRGDIIIDVHNWGTETIYLDNIAVTLVVRSSNGAIAAYGLGAD